MHWIQRHILKQLAFADNLRYSEIKPDGVEGNLFQYHARDLEKQGLIIRSGDGYSLTPAGSHFVADLSQTKAMNRKTPPRVVVMISAINEQGEQLMFEWRRHPYRGQVSLPFGRQFAGQSSVEVAADQLLYKSGYSADFEYLGLVSLIAPDDHLLIQVFAATNLTGEHGSDGLTGTSFWAKREELGDHALLLGAKQIFAWLASPERESLLEINLPVDHP